MYVLNERITWAFSLSLNAQFTQKWKSSSLLFTLMSYFRWWDTKEDILKNTEVQTTLDFHCMD